jgi:hypothetical protein
VGWCGAESEVMRGRAAIGNPRPRPPPPPPPAVRPLLFLLLCGHLLSMSEVKQGPSVHTGGEAGGHRCMLEVKQGGASPPPVHCSPHIICIQ